MSMSGEGRLQWWQTPRFALVAILLAIVPLLGPALPPLTDLPGHIGRYRVMVAGSDPVLRQHFAFHWSLIGNLGIDLIVQALHPLFDVEAASRLAVMAIPPLTIAAMIWVAREAHGRVPPAAMFAFPLAFAFPFQFGFVNFTLAAALALAGLAGWIRLERRGWKGWQRALLFVPVACVVWVCHSFGWAMLGLFVLGADWAMRHARGDRGWRAILPALLVCAPMALPQLLGMLLPHDQLAGQTGDWFNWQSKASWLVALLRERWKAYDVASIAVIFMLLWTVIRSRRLSFESILGVPAALGCLAFVLLPRLYAGGAYVDMRLAPYAIALALLAIRVDGDDDVLARRLALGGTAFFAVRMATTSLAFLLIAQRQHAALEAVDHLPVGSAVLVLVNEPCASQWQNDRLTHLDGLAIARRRVFTNGQWTLAGQQLIVPLHPGAGRYRRDPSQLVYPRHCEFHPTIFAHAVRDFDRQTFDYVWTIGFPSRRALAPDAKLLWHNGVSAVYRVAR